MVDECKAAVAALMPTLGGVDMSFLPAFAVNTPTSSDLLDSSSSADNATTDSSDAIDTSDEEEDDDEPCYDALISKKSRRIYERRPIEKSAWWYLFLSPLSKERNRE